MLITEFVEKFNNVNAEEQQKLVTECIKRRYVPVAEKTGKLRVTLNSSIISVDGGVPYVDMTLNHILYVYAVITLYTDIQPTKDETDKIDTLGLYDLLKEHKIFNLIVDTIGDDLIEMNYINEQVLNTWQLQNASTRAFVSSTLKDFSGLSDALAQKLEAVVKNLSVETNK